jgi:hypothetical protein
MRELVDWMRAPISIQDLKAQKANCFRYMYEAGEK